MNFQDILNIFKKLDNYSSKKFYRRGFHFSGALGYEIPQKVPLGKSDTKFLSEPDGKDSYKIQKPTLRYQERSYRNTR